MPRQFPDIFQPAEEFERKLGLFHELMPRRVSDILLISSLYDYCIMEEDGRLAERIIHEYRGLNLTKPPRITWVASVAEALRALERQSFQLVIAMPRLSQKDPTVQIKQIRQLKPELPIILLTHHHALDQTCVQGEEAPSGFDRIFVWTGNTDLLVAQIKNVEDGWNVEHDTQTAGVRVILFVEDSPFYLSSLLPILYKEVVGQTQAAIEEGLNEEHRILTMRSRAKILVAHTYEEALRVFDRYKPFLLGVISDVAFPRACRIDDNAGPDLLRTAKNEIPDLPMLMTSSDPANRVKAEQVGAGFVDKNSRTLHAEIRSFFMDHLGFGDFVFRLPDGSEVARAAGRRAVEQSLKQIPIESFIYHANRNDFSRWFFARAENGLAQRLRPISGADFDGDMQRMRLDLQRSLELQRRWRQKGVVVDFSAEDFDPDTEYLKIGRGSLGGKARGLAFIARLLKMHRDLNSAYPEVELIIPQTLVITTDVFDVVTGQANLKRFSELEMDDAQIARHFLEADLPPATVRQLRAFLTQVRHPLAVRSSGLLEDAQFMAYAGLYQTYMLPNDHPDPDQRLRQLIDAIRLVYASTYFSGPKAFARRVGQRTEEEKMAVIVQRIIGNTHQGFFYPTLSGVAQSFNYYPFGRVRPEDGCATIALGLGKTVAEGGGALRFSPRHPQVLPQFASVDDALKNSQHRFYAVCMGGGSAPTAHLKDPNLALREVSDAHDEPPLQLAAGTYVAEEHRIRDTAIGPGPRVITFAQMLKYNAFPLPGLLSDVLELAREGMGAPVEIEFSVDPLAAPGKKQIFAILQARPMTAKTVQAEVTISDREVQQALCCSTRALGNTQREDIRDLVFVQPRRFKAAHTREIVPEIAHFNRRLSAENRPYLLIGPGRWGSSDPWLGIPVGWGDISGVAAIVESGLPEMRTEPSQGSHFFHNIATLGISYLSIHGPDDALRWERLEALPATEEKSFTVHVRLPRPCLLKVDGRRSLGVIVLDACSKE